LGALRTLHTFDALIALRTFNRRALDALRALRTTRATRRFNDDDVF
jgi:hypothetical protein